MFDPSTLDWSTGEERWRAPGLPGAVIYELHVGTFTPARTLDGAAQRLGALAELGVTHVELMPLAAFSGTHGWGYDGVLWYAVHEPYGGPAALARFVDAAHRQGLAVVLDVVHNHLGPSGNHLPDFGPYLTEAYRTPWGEALNLDGPHSDPVRAFIVGNALHWLSDFHVDGLRLDAVHALIDTSSVHVLTDLTAAVGQRSTILRRPLQVIAESHRNDPLTVLPRAQGGRGLDAQWVDDLHHAIHAAVTGERDGYYIDYRGLPEVAAAYRRGFVFDGRYSRYRERTVGAPLGDVPGHRLVSYLQNHDQIGNRAFGERLTTLVDPALVRVAAVLLCAAPTTPLLFMGEEYGETQPFQYFTSHPEPPLAEAVRRGRLQEFAAFAGFTHRDAPDPQDPGTLARSTLRWERASSEEGCRRLALWRDLLRLRREIPALGNGRRDLVQMLSCDERHLVLRRGDPWDASVVLAVNLAQTEQMLTLPRVAVWRTLLDTEDARYGGEGNTAQTVAHHDRALLRIQGNSAALLTPARP